MPVIYLFFFLETELAILMKNKDLTGLVPGRFFFLNCLPIRHVHTQPEIIHAHQNHSILSHGHAQH